MKKEISLVVLLGVIGLAWWWFAYYPEQVFDQELEKLFELKDRNPVDFELRIGTRDQLQKWLDDISGRTHEINDLTKLSIKQFHEELIEYRDWLSESADSHFVIDIYVDEDELVFYFTERIRDWSQYLGTHSFYWTP